MANERLSKLERKQSIQQITRQLFLTKGFRQTTMQDIVKATGLSFGGLYYHYRQPQEILVDLLQAGNQERLTRMTQALTQLTNPQPLSTLAELIVDKLLAENEDIALYVLLLQEVKRDPDLAQVYQTLKADAYRELQALCQHFELPHIDMPHFELLTDLINGFYLTSELLGTRHHALPYRQSLIQLVLEIFSL